jgi:protein-tyrosine phosphatase
MPNPTDRRPPDPADPSARRVVRLEGTSNFRDLGGYPGWHGRRLRWGRLFRSAHLGGLTARDQQQVARLGITRVLDFRGGAERAATPNRLSGVAEHSLAIEPTVVQRMDALVAAGRTLNAALVGDLMCDLYRGLVNTQAARFAELFDHLLATDAPLVFHCTAGKDRTGIAAALVLLALGVPRDVVRRDYLLTNDVFEHPPLPHNDTPPEALAVLWRVQEGFLDAALQVIDTEHGGPERYLRQRLGLSDAALDALAARYLEPAAP